MAGTVELQKGRVLRGEAGIIEVIGNDDVSVEVADIEEALEAELALMGERATVLVDARGVRTMTRAAQRLTTEHPVSARADAVAILVDGPVSRMLGSFFLSIALGTRPGCLPTRPRPGLGSRATVSDECLEMLHTVLRQLASRDHEVRVPVGGARDELDAICVGVDLLAEALGHERTQRARAQALLSDAVEAYEGAPAVFCSVERPKRVMVRCNRTMSSLLGVSGDALLGWSLPSWSMAPTKVLAALEQLATHGAQAPEVFWLHLGGEALPARLVDVRVSGGQQGRVRVVLRDARSDLRAEGHERERQKMQVLAEIRGGVAHDLNNLLAVMRMVSSAAREVGHGEILEILEDLDVASRGGTNLAQWLLAVSVERRERLLVDPTGAIRTAARLARRAASSTVSVSAVVPDPLPPVSVDPSERERVVLNLVTNRLEAMPHGGDLSIEADQVDGLVGARVRDTGIGMAPAIRVRAVEPLFTTKPHGGGFGLALAVALCERAGGVLELQTVQGEGTTVELRLPTPSRRGVA